MATHWELIQARVTKVYEDGDVGIQMLDIEEFSKLGVCELALTIWKLMQVSNLIFLQELCF